MGACYSTKTKNKHKNKISEEVHIDNTKSIDIDFDALP